MTWQEDYYAGSSDYPDSRPGGPELPDGWTLDAGLGGYDRPTWLVLNEDEVRLAFSDNPQPEVVCGYCDQRCRSRSSRTAVRWFHAHDCGPQEATETAGILYGLGALPADHPFADAA